MIIKQPYRATCKEPFIKICHIAVFRRVCKFADPEMQRQGKMLHIMLRLLWSVDSNAEAFAAGDLW